MGIIFALIGFIALGTLLHRFYSLELLSEIVVVLGGVLLVISVVMLPMNHYLINSKITEYKSVAQTITNARHHGEMVENAALQLKVVEANQWLASTQYWNHTLFGDWIPDTVDQLNPIQ